MLFDIDLLRLPLSLGGSTPCISLKSLAIKAHAKHVFKW